MWPPVLGHFCRRNESESGCRACNTFPSLHLQSGRQRPAIYHGLRAARLLMVLGVSGCSRSRDQWCLAPNLLTHPGWLRATQVGWWQRLREDLRIVREHRPGLNGAGRRQPGHASKPSFEAEQADQVKPRSPKVLRELADQLPTRSRKLERRRGLGFPNGYRFGLERPPSWLD